MTETLVHEGAGAVATVRSAATGDAVAFTRLVEAHHRSMARVAYVIVGDIESANDAVQTAWAIAWQRLGSLRDPSRVRAWLIAIAANEARKGLTRRRREAMVVDISDQIEADPAADPVSAIETVDLIHAMRGLSGEQRSLLAMRYVAGLDATEIGHQLGISASGVRSRLARTLQRLREDLDVTAENER
jgi:RNA polymerase sigma-70 factor (ECF subfamily)